MRRSKSIYSYEVVNQGGVWVIIARGPKGGKRYIADYNKQWAADKVASIMNKYAQD
jgi:hypothetical protein